MKAIAVTAVCHEYYIRTSYPVLFDNLEYEIAIEEVNHGLTNHSITLIESSANMAQRPRI